MIPVLAVPILNRPDLLAAMLASVDEPVERLYVVDNGAVVDGLAWNGPCHVTRPGYNMGCAASWNLAIRANINAPWWLISSVDVLFGGGDLAAVAELMADPSPRAVCIFGFAAFALNAAAIDAVGWFDENFTPMYYEDSDWAYRAQVLGVPAVHLGGTTRHESEITVKSDPHVAAHNRETMARNRARYAAKWGRIDVLETFATPFGTGQDARHWTQPSVAWLRQQRWPS